MRVMEVRLILHNLHIHHVMIRSELKYLIGANQLGLQKPGFEVETGPNAHGPGFSCGKPLPRFGSASNPNLEPF